MEGACLSKYRLVGDSRHVLAMRGIHGPLEVFEGNKGFMQSVAGPFKVDWRIKTFKGVLYSIVKRYNAEIHSQSALEGVLELRARHEIKGAEISGVEVEYFRPPTTS